MPPTYYRGCWHVVSRGLFPRYRPVSSLGKGVYNPKAFVPHATSLGQAFAHCPRFPAAASRRSGGRVSVPLWLVILSDQLPVIGLVGHYPTNYLIGREPLPRRPMPFIHAPKNAHRMRDYPQFPEAIPHRRAGYSRVTQPFAAFPLWPKPRTRSTCMH